MIIQCFSLSFSFSTKISLGALELVWSQQLDMSHGSLLRVVAAFGRESVTQPGQAIQLPVRHDSFNATAVALRCFVCWIVFWKSRRTVSTFWPTSTLLWRLVCVTSFLFTVDLFVYICLYYLFCFRFLHLIFIAHSSCPGGVWHMHFMAFLLVSRFFQLRSSKLITHFIFNTHCPNASH